MNQSWKIMWGGATFLPVFLAGCAFLLSVGALWGSFLDLQGMETGWVYVWPAVYGLFAAAAGVWFLLKIFYFIHLVRHPRMDRDARTLWVILFLTLGWFAMAAYWIRHIWPKEAQEQPAAKSKMTFGKAAAVS